MRNWSDFSFNSLKTKKIDNSVKIRESQNIIIIIDPQKDFTDPCGIYAKSHSSIYNILLAKEKIQNLINLKNHIDKVIVFSTYIHNQFKENYQICLPNTFGHEIDLDNINNILKFNKNSRSAFSSSDLKEYLENKKIKEIYLAGFLTEYCIYDSALQILEEDKYSVYLLEDCIATADDASEKGIKAIEILVKKGAKLSSSKSLNDSMLEISNFKYK